MRRINVLVGLGIDGRTINAADQTKAERTIAAAQEQVVLVGSPEEVKALLLGLSPLALQRQLQLLTSGAEPGPTPYDDLAKQIATAGDLFADGTSIELTFDHGRES